MTKIKINPHPYQIEQIARGSFKVLDEKGNLLKADLSLHGAQQYVIEMRLQDRALNDPDVRLAAAKITGYTGESLHNWLYTTLIHFDKDDLRVVIQKPSKLKALQDAYIERMKKRLNKPSDDLATLLIPITNYLKENAPDCTIIISLKGFEVLKRLTEEG